MVELKNELGKNSLMRLSPSARSLSNMTLTSSVRLWGPIQRWFISALCGKSFFCARIRVFAIPRGCGVSSLSKSLILCNRDFSLSWSLGTSESNSSTLLSWNYGRHPVWSTYPFSAFPELLMPPPVAVCLSRIWIICAGRSGSRMRCTAAARDAIPLPISHAWVSFGSRFLSPILVLEWKILKYLFVKSNGMPRPPFYRRSLATCWWGHCSANNSSSPVTVLQLISWNVY